VTLEFTGSFHHIGLACRRIADEIPGVESLGYLAEGPPIEDPIQRVRLQFFVGAGPRLELIEPTADDSPVQGVLKKGGKLYHLAYETAAFEGDLAVLEGQGYRAVAPAAPAVAFGMRRIIFLLSSNFLLVELIEAAPV
jgi:methylmalonyl-CoA/ethylmalonyl-CoA epimerase